MSGPCDNDSPNLAYDGPNVVIGFANEWRYYGGPGVSDPLIGLLRKPNGTSRPPGCPPARLPAY